ncbi:hypothetical protein ARAM_005635, partial [Aspergillus rambellii]
MSPPNLYSNPDRQTLDFADDISDDGLYYSSSSSRMTKHTHPLIHFVRNEWQTNPKYSHLSPASDRTEAPRWVQIVGSIVTAPRFRRYAVVYFGLLLSCWIGWHFVLSPRLEEQTALLKSLDPHEKGWVGWFGSNSLPELTDVIQLGSLDPKLLPAAKTPQAGEPNHRRLVVVGDVHGCKMELERLLEEVSFDKDHDHLIFTGDLINKGPDSPGVVDLARKYSASCVRGNHEDRVLLLRHEMDPSNPLTNNSRIETDPLLNQNRKERELARRLTDEQAKWLDACPIILNVGQITGMGQVVVVHAGLIPGVDLEKQDPYSVMNMRTIDLDTHVPSASHDGMKWSKLFNKHQSLLSSTLKDGASDAGSGVMMTVLYGHDAKNSLSLKTYTKGLDSGCVKGGKLTALVIQDGGQQNIVQ